MQQQRVERTNLLKYGTLKRLSTHRGCFVPSVDALRPAITDWQLSAALVRVELEPASLL